MVSFVKMQLLPRQVDILWCAHIQTGCFLCPGTSRFGHVYLKDNRIIGAGYRNSLNFRLLLQNHERQSMMGSRISLNQSTYMQQVTVVCPWSLLLVKISHRNFIHWLHLPDAVSHYRNPLVIMFLVHFDYLHTYDVQLHNVAFTQYNILLMLF